MDEIFHAPDFIIPDFTQPALQRVDMTTPGFTLPDPTQPAITIPLSLWPDDVEQFATNQPDPTVPDLTNPDADVDMPNNSMHVLPTPSYEPEVTMEQRPGTLDPTAWETLRDSADETELPPDINYPQLYTRQDDMSTRKRHLGMLELGLEQTKKVEP